MYRMTYGYTIAIEMCKKLRYNEIMGQFINMWLSSSQLTKADIYLNLMETTRSTSHLRPFYFQGVYTNTVKDQFIPFLTGIIVDTSVSSSGKLEIKMHLWKKFSFERNISVSSSNDISISSWQYGMWQQTTLIITRWNKHDVVYYTRMTDIDLWDHWCQSIHCLMGKLSVMNMFSKWRGVAEAGYQGQGHVFVSHSICRMALIPGRPWYLGPVWI